MPFSSKPKRICDLCTRDVHLYPDFANNSHLPADIKNNCPLQTVRLRKEIEIKFLILIIFKAIIQVME